jgi:hypothetical protein
VETGDQHNRPGGRQQKVYQIGGIEHTPLHIGQERLTTSGVRIPQRENSLFQVFPEEDVRRVEEATEISHQKDAPREQDRSKEDAYSGHKDQRMKMSGGGLCKPI